MKKEGLFVLIIFVLTLLTVTMHAVTEGNLTTGGNITSGLGGSTVPQYCNTTSQCAGIWSGYACFTDFDSVSVSPNSGWCFPSTQTECIADSTFYSSSTSTCYNSTAKITCNSGSWSSAVRCSSSGTCTNGTCSSSTTTTTTTTTSGGSSGGDNTTATPTKSIHIINGITDFEITQGQSVLKSISFENNGQTNLSDVVITVSGITDSWIFVIPDKIPMILSGEQKTFVINFSIPSNAEVKDYTTTFTVGNSLASAQTVPIIKIMPSNETVTTVILPLYDEYLKTLNELKALLLKSGKTDSDLLLLLNNIEDKLNQTGTAIENKNYFAANTLLSETGSLIDEFRAKLNMAGGSAATGDSNLFIIAIVVLVIIIAIVGFHFMPRKNKIVQVQKSKKEAIAEVVDEKVDSIADKIKKLRKLRKAKEQGEKFAYQFKR